MEDKQSMSCTIRVGLPEDINKLHALISELAAFERSLPEVTNTPEQLLHDGFKENPLFGFYVAEVAGEVIGFVLYYYRYSTWKGKVLYIEDLYINPAQRGQGVGKLLIEVMQQHAKTEQCQRLMLQVLDWNESAIAFYQKMGMTIDKEWLNVYKKV